MGNTNSCIRHLHEIFSFLMGGSSMVKSTESVSTSGTRTEDQIKCSFKESVEGGRRSSSGIEEQTREQIRKQIERSKFHWSEIAKSDCDCDEEELERVGADNREVFKTLQRHPQWGSFFRIFHNVSGRSTLMVGERFAEGAQAELFHARVNWSDPMQNERDAKRGTKWVLKVFKQGTLLCDLQKQWPQGMLKFHAEKSECAKPGKPQLV